MMLKSLFNIPRTFLILSLLTSCVFSTEADKKVEQKPKKKESKEIAPVFNSDRNCFIVKGDILYWNLQGGDTSYIIKNELVNSSYTKQEYASTPFTYDPGMRFSLGYYKATSAWQANIDYTFIRLHSKSSCQASDNIQLTSLFANAPSNTLLGGKSSSSVSYKTTNLLGSRIFLFESTPDLKIKLDGGVCFAWLKQDWKINYSYSDHIAQEVQNNWSYWGGGLRLALSFDYLLGDDIYLSGRCSPALVCGHLIQNSTTANFDNSNPGAKTALHYDDYRLSFNTNFSLGPSYQKPTSWGRIEFFAGYEMEMWTNVWEVIRILDASNSRQITSNLFSIQGITGRCSIYF